jgi:integrase
LALKATREEMIRLGWCRTYINRQTLRIKSVFRWAVENEYVEAKVYEALRAVAGLRTGKSEAREPVKVRPVADVHAAAVFQYLSPQVSDMIRLQALTGMRSTEVCTMRGCDVDMAAEPWRYRPATHKTAHLGHDRVIDLGPQAQAIVKRHLKSDLSAYLFNPADAADHRRRVRAAARNTPVTCGNVPGSNRKRSPRLRPGNRTTATATASPCREGGHSRVARWRSRHFRRRDL